MKLCTICLKPKEAGDFNKRAKSLDGLQPVCRECQNVRGIKKYRENPKSVIDRVRTRTVKNQDKVNKYKSSLGCMKCGIKEPAIILDLDHLNNKMHNVSRMICHSFENISTEILKCQILCSNCHRTETYFRKNNTLEPMAPKKAIKTPVLMRMWTKLLEFKNRSCIDCGQTYHFAAMDCDHRNPLEKIGEPSNLARSGPEEVFYNELKKCEVVCSNCHRIRTNAKPALT